MLASHIGGFESKQFESKLLASIQACKTRTILTAEQAVEIFKVKLSNQLSPSKKRNKTRKVAETFGISDKAVRDIWNGRTWLRETMHLDPARIAMAAARRPPGRPKVFEGRAGPHFQNRSSCIHAAVDSPLHFQPAAQSLPTPSLLVSDEPLTEANDASSQQEKEPFPAAAIAAAHSKGGSCWDILRRQRSFHESWAAPLLAGDAAASAPPLPESSRADDPFHDDWEHWP